MNIFSRVILYGILCVMPFFVKNKYFDMSVAKSRFFNVFLIAVFVSLILAIPLYYIVGKSKEKHVGIRICRQEIAAVFFAGIVLISMLLSADPVASLWGTKGWKVGGFTLLGVISIYFFLSRNLEVKDNIWYAVAFANIAIFLFTILHSMKVDIFGLHKGINPQQYFDYMSTIGQKNWLSGYLSLIYIFFVGKFIISSKKFEIVLYGVVVAFGTMNVVLSGSDGTYIAIALCAAFAIPFVMKNKNNLSRFMLILIYFGCSLMLVDLLPVFRDKALAMGDGIPGMLLNRMIYLPLLAVAIGFFVFLRLYKKELSGRFSLISTIILEILWGISIALVVVNIIREFSPEWGTGRGKIWIRGWNSFKEFSIKEKLLGVGPELLAPYFEKTMKVRLLVAHSEFLQYLMSTGILGVISYCAIWVGVIAAYFKNRLWQRNEVIYVLPLTAYLGQAFINSPGVLNVCILSIFFAVMRIEINKNKNRERRERNK